MCIRDRFQIKQDNVAELDPAGGVLPDGGTPYRAAQGVTTRGFEMEISGEVTPGWQLHAGYTYSRSRDRDGIRVSSTQPQQLFKLATTYRLPGDWHRLTVGGNVYWQSLSLIHILLGSGRATEQDRQRFERWLASCPENARAWGCLLYTSRCV